MSRQKTIFPDDFISTSELYNLSKTAHDNMWKQYKKIDFDAVVKTMKSQSKVFKQFAKDRTGLDFAKMSVSKNESRGTTSIRINLSGLDGQDLGFYGNYIKELAYQFSMSGSPYFNKVTGEFVYYVNCGIGYSHIDGGSNGVSDDGFTVRYNLTNKKLSVEKRA